MQQTIVSTRLTYTTVVQHHCYVRVCFGNLHSFVHASTRSSQIVHQPFRLEQCHVGCKVAVSSCTLQDVRCSDTSEVLRRSCVCVEHLLMNVYGIQAESIEDLKNLNYCVCA